MSARPNILFIITHDTGRHLGCYGCNVRTPELDRLARRAVLFENYFCTAPQCSPSRGSIISGRWPHCHGLIGLVHRGFSLDPAVPLLPAVLAAGGYSTHLFGFQHESSDPPSLGYREVHRDAEHGHSCRFVLPMLDEFLRSRPPEPFFASVGFTETHRPYPHSDAPIDSVSPLPYLPDEPPVRQDVADLHVLVERVDAAVGNILRTLDDTGLAESTVVIFTTDHGIAMPRAKATLFDPGVETALVMALPERRFAGLRVTAQASNIDIMPTLLELAGLQVPDGVQGMSFMPLVRSDTDSLHDATFHEMTFHAAYDPVRAVRTPSYKYIRSYASRSFAVAPNVDAGHAKGMFRSMGLFDSPRSREQLYDLVDDPFEQRNLAADPAHAHVLEELRSSLDRWMRDTGDPLLHGPVAPPPGSVITPVHAYGPGDDLITVGPDTVIE
ncbi:MAG: sulfatase [Planctomycetes bacterium]|nr:sulfatase [Planctomycetota bacterium]